jgi:hypothetical protein
VSLPHQIAAYEDCFEIFDAALADPKGARACPITREKAYHLRMRMNMARYLHRRESMRMYPVEDQRHGKSEYDKLKTTIKEDTSGEWWVYVERWGGDIAVIEPLTEVEESNGLL